MFAFEKIQYSHYHSNPIVHWGFVSYLGQTVSLDLAPLLSYDITALPSTSVQVYDTLTLDNHF